VRGIGRLLRLSLAASAPADAAAGALVGAGGWPGGVAPWALCLGSACVYHGGMALNDWADREHDRRTRPERPIPSGTVSSATALLLGIALLVVGPALALAFDRRAGGVLVAVALLAALYDLAGRGPWRGPLLLGLCRAGNLGAGVLLGLAAAGRGLDGAAVVLPLAYGLYVFVVSRLGRLEDAEDDRSARLLSPRGALVVLGLLLLAPSLAPLSGSAWAPEPGRAVALAIGLAGALALFRRARAPVAPEPAAIVPLMGLALRRLLVFSAASAALAGPPAGLVGSALILAGLPAGYALRRVFPPS
jgi:4-hydroxybenzoate polyprenyltransferase